jgi:hypothetical protein
VQSRSLAYASNLLLNLACASVANQTDKKRANS